MHADFEDMRVAMFFFPLQMFYPHCLSFAWKMTTCSLCMCYQIVRCIHYTRGKLDFHVVVQSGICTKMDAYAVPYKTIYRI